MDLTPAQQRAIRHGEGPLLVLGRAGTGKTEVLARRLSWLAGRGTEPNRALLLTSTRATAQRLRERVETLLDGPRDELWIGTWDVIGERLLREHSDAAGLDPLFEVLGRAERLAMLLDRLDELPLRQHEIRGNPAGLLTRLLERIDTLKAGSSPPEPEFAELYAAHDRILAEAGDLDGGDLFLTLSKLLTECPDVRRAVGSRFAHVMVDELEDTTPAQRAILASLAGEHSSHSYALDRDGRKASSPAGAVATGGNGAGRAASAPRQSPRAGEPRAEDRAPSVEDWVLSVHPSAEVVELEERFRDPAVRFWRCSNERAQAQAVAREVEHLLATGTAPASICVVIDEPALRGRMVSAAMEERGIPLHLSGPGALFQRPEVRDAIAWLRVLVDPADSAAAARALSRPPIELSPADLARLTTIARRRSLNMVSACQAALESPDTPPEAGERIQAFLKLHRAASAAIEERRADVFVRRLIERIGLRRQRLFAAEPEVAERLLGLSRLAELAAAWARREPHGSTRDLVRHLSAISDAGVEPAGVAEPPVPGAVQGVGRNAVKGMEFERVFILGLEHGADAERIGWPGRSGLVLSRVEREGEGEVSPSPFYEDALSSYPDASEETHEEELFGPAEGLHATYRMLREKVLEESWRAGRQLSEPRLDTAVDIDRAIARYLELLKLAALAQRPADEPTAEAIEAVNGLLRQVATPGQQAELDASQLDTFLLKSERDRESLRRLLAAREERSLRDFLPLRSDGALSLSASDLDLYRTCPLKYKFARVFGIPQEPTINQRFGILVHNVLERFHKEAEGEEDGLDRLMGLFEAGWHRAGFGSSDDELQFRDRAREALRLYLVQEGDSEGEPVWLERQFDIRIGDHHVRGRVDRVDRLPDGGYELIDYKTGERKSEADLKSDLQLALYRVAAREAWDLEAEAGSYYYVLDAEKVATPTDPGDAERVERTVLEVGEGILSEDFEPRPSPSVCSWCDYRLICPAAEI